MCATRDRQAVIETDDEMLVLTGEASCERPSGRIGPRCRAGWPLASTVWRVPGLLNASCLDELLKGHLKRAPQSGDRRAEASAPRCLLLDRTSPELSAARQIDRLPLR
jgi:hypothetical protein